MKPESVDHADFGTLEWDDDFERYSVTIGDGHDAFDIGFEESDRESLEDLLQASAALWREKEQWFAQWRKACFDYYVKELKDAWYEGDEPLDEAAFNTKIGLPAGIEFSWSEGKLHYMITGMDDDLVGDHALEAHGTELVPNEVFLT